MPPLESALCKALERIDELTSILKSDDEEQIGDAAGIGSKVNDLIGCFQSMYDSGTGMDDLSLSNLPTEILTFLDGERGNPALYQIKKNETIDANRKVISERINYLQRVASIVELSVNPSATTVTSTQPTKQAGKKRAR